MLFRKLMICTALLISGSLASAAETDLMLCSLENGGSVKLTANENQQVSLYFDSRAQSALGKDRALNLSTTLEAVDSGSTQGAVDFMEIGAGYDGSGGDCGMGLDFAYQSVRDFQLLRDNREIPLKPGKGGYRMVSCGQKSLGVENCYAIGSLSSVTGLKNLLRTVIGD